MNIRYTLSFPEPHSHYLHVEMQVNDIRQEQIALKMPVWTPGSYLIREFQRNIDFVTSTINEQTVRLKKRDKNTWILPLADATGFTVNYQLYCNELSVRTNFVNSDFALLNGAATFLYLEGYEKNAVEIIIQPYEKWDKCSTALHLAAHNYWVRKSDNLDELVDSPILLGNHLSFSFEACGVKHELAMQGISNCNPDKLITDLQKMIAEEVKVFGDHPCRHYTFINIHTASTYGGLEHAHSSVNMLPRWNFDAKNYAQSIGLLSHEYFHLWNVKRIRPFELSTYNYDTESYTELLWFFEGVTSYYDDLVNRRAGILSKDEYLEIITSNLQVVMNTPGIAVQTLAESSYDTWLKYYRKNENSNNATISYYTKGAIVAMLFDFMLMDATDSEKSLDDVMRLLYAKYKSAPETGITEADILHALNETGGMDFSSYIQQFIHTPTPLPIEFYFDLIGFDLLDQPKKESIFMGFSLSQKEGKFVVSEVIHGFGAFAGGLNVDDEILTIDNFKMNSDFTRLYEHKKINDTLTFIVSRQGEIKTLQLPATADTRHQFRLVLQENLSEKQRKLLKKWLR